MLPSLSTVGSVPQTLSRTSQTKSPENSNLSDIFKENIAAKLTLNKLINQQMSFQNCSFESLSDMDGMFILEDFLVQCPNECKLLFQSMSMDNPNPHLDLLQSFKNYCSDEKALQSDTNTAMENSVTLVDALTTTQALNQLKPRHFQSADQPPIRELTSEEANAAIEIMRDKMSAWTLYLEPNDEQKQWNDRINETISMLYPPETCSEETKIFAYYVDKIPVGIIVMSRTTQPKIQQLVTHPGSEGAGGSLIEQAIKQSLTWKCSGTLSLWPRTDNARRAYQGMGFSNATGDMELNPALRRDKFVWVEDAQTWKFKSHLGKGYIHSCSLPETSSNSSEVGSNSN